MEIFANSNFVLKYSLSFEINVQDLIFIYNNHNIYLFENNIPTFKQVGILTDKFVCFGRIGNLQCLCLKENLFLNDREFNLVAVKNAFEVLTIDFFHAVSFGYYLNNSIVNNKYCGNCGSLYKLNPIEIAFVCDNCNNIRYPIISPCIIVLIYKDNEILLAKHVLGRKDIFTCLAGYVHPMETLENAVRREVMEEVGIEVSNIQYIASQPWVYTHALMIGFFAKYESGHIQIDSTEIIEAKWFNINTLPEELPNSKTISRYLINAFIDNNFNRLY